jgi:hypothetical protein
VLYYGGNKLCRTFANKSAVKGINQNNIPILFKFRHREGQLYTAEGARNNKIWKEIYKQKWLTRNLAVSYTKK